MTNSENKGENKNASTDNSAKSENASSAEPKFPPGEEKWGYDLYPERRGERHRTNWVRAFFMLEGRDAMQKVRCEKNVYECVRSSPLVKLMMGALKSSGCEINIRRHIVCEFCSESVSGGYDPELNQIVVCQNTSKSKGIVQGVLTHEMIHMFDFCRYNLDFKNIDHLACTEIRAANLTHCSFLSAVTRGDAAFWNIKGRQQECVKNKAVHSVMSVRNITYEQAREAVDRTFPKCYPDMEPIGRRLRPRSTDVYKAYYEAPLYGYDY
ncbi:mitochondrial inner membrane protease ATP23 homolog isoform X2 [Venturia canescens]|uniref:mitochondrial inner membrane protease ATP23 homolog isoform X2 n=1 Tax=Venturia canescens TaxID=32260 RepID=UPI001C9D5B34|nr:mitochondrial inner membrane protease ATP23 homolog isoform X2 [Venturia canescens]